ncbi:MAG TPA: hypothetical protein VH413_16170 [Verrucomicrobiae bacterium]|jgi:hypothetical protein|nr:hypothetical protein [Verrucomicrobiae bacterium]
MTYDNQRLTLAQLLPNIFAIRRYSNGTYQIIKRGGTQFEGPVPTFDPLSFEAIHQIEALLLDVSAIEVKRSYVNHLMNIVGVSPNMNGKWSFIQDFALIHATKFNKAQAMLRAFGHWKDSETTEPSLDFEI